MLSAMQGVSTLMTSIIGLDYKVCVVIVWLSFTIFTVYSGSKGVLITDTIMFLVFLVAAIISIPYIVNEAVGWNIAVTALAQSTTRPRIIAWKNIRYIHPEFNVYIRIWSAFGTDLRGVLCTAVY